MPQDYCVHLQLVYEPFQNLSYLHQWQTLDTQQCSFVHSLVESSFECFCLRSHEGSNWLVFAPTIEPTHQVLLDLEQVGFSCPPFASKLTHQQGPYLLFPSSQRIDLFHQWQIDSLQMPSKLIRPSVPTSFIHLPL